MARRCRPCAVLPPLCFWIGVADRDGSTATDFMARRCRPCAVLPPLYLWIGVADRVRFYRRCICGSALPTVLCGSTAADVMARRCRPCAVLPPLTLNAGSTPIPNSETGTLPVDRVYTSPVAFREPRRSVRRRCPLQHPCSGCRRGTGVSGAPASNDLTLWCGLLQLAFHATCLHRCCGGDRLGLLARRRVASLARTNSLQAHRISCWSPWWGAGPLSGALLGDGAS